MPLTGPHRVDCHAAGACRRSPDLPFAEARDHYAREVTSPRWSRVELVCCETNCVVWGARGGVMPPPQRKGARA